MSAKRQNTRIGAIKAALFFNDEEVIRAREAIFNANPAAVLILGTSVGMVKKIADRLGLPELENIIFIEDVASSKEIRKAKLMRSQYSKHVIPAPTVEVKKSFPDTLINPLQVFMRRHEPSGKKSWLEQSVVRATFTNYGRLTISPSAIASIATHAAEPVVGLVKTRKIGRASCWGRVYI